MSAYDSTKTKEWNRLMREYYGDDLDDVDDCDLVDMFGCEIDGFEIEEPKTWEWSEEALEKHPRLRKR